MSPRQSGSLTVLSRNRRLFHAGLAASVALHALALSLYLLPQVEEEEEVVARIEWDEEKTPFFLPEPQLTREFAFRKEAVPEGTPVVRSSGDRTTTTVSGRRMVRAGMPVGTRMWSRTGGSSEFTVAAGTGLGDAVVAMPQFEAVSIASMKEPERRIDMQAEFLDLSAINTGRYKGMVIQDPTDKTNVTGFVYLARAWGTILEPSRPRALLQLARWINNWTRIEAKVDEQMYLDSQALFKAPFVYITTGSAFELTKHEAANLGKYLRNGGFVLADNDVPRLEYGPAEASIKAMFKQALGRDARFVPLRDDNPIYRVFFDFDGGPPLGGEVLNTSNQYAATRRPSYWLEGIYLRDRLVAVYSDKGYGAIWERETENEPQLKLGVNLVVFALTQKGSIAQQQIDFYNQAGRQ